ncbi:MAG: histidine kinase dimerization/phosphoacceptor domain -containing protein [Flavobacteriia bacterium]
MKKEEILAKIDLLESELALLKKQLPISKTVKVPDEMKPIFDGAQMVVEEYFKKLEFNPEEGSIKIDDERYILVRASSLSHEFFKNFEQNFPDKSKEEIFTITKDFLFDIGHVIGIQDAKKFHFKMNLNDPLSKLSAGPIHFAYAGWASVDILPESNPSPDENFFLKYHHPYSFEADSWIKSGERAENTVCIMNAAYSSGWCESSFGIPLTAVELSCRAKGDEHCTFIMAQPDQINRFLELEKKTNQITSKIDIPFFFERKNIEEQLLKNEEMLSTAQKIAKMGSWEFDILSSKLTWSDELYEIFEIDKNSVSNLDEAYFSKINEDDQKAIAYLFKKCQETGKPYKIEHKIHLDKKSTKSLYCLGRAKLNSAGEIIKIYGVAQDITEAKNQNLKLLENLNEKEVLLKEVHHRVKNNLQIISSLLNLQAGFINDKEMNALYKESQNRIKSIASVHELLYQSKELSKIPFDKYLKKLVDDLMISYYGIDHKIKLFINTRENFNIDTSIPLGLLINEIVSNALKHGLKNEGNDFIYINIFKINYKNYQLKIGDNGKGFENFNEVENPETLGLMLIKELSNQLNGTMIKTEEKGTHYALSFTSN